MCVGREEAREGEREGREWKGRNKERKGGAEREEEMDKFVLCLLSRI